MDRTGDSGIEACRQHADVRMAKALGGVFPSVDRQYLFPKNLITDHLPEGLAETEMAMVACRDRAVDIGKLVGHPELPFGEGVWNILACLPDQSELEIVDGRRYISSHEGYQSPADKIRQERTTAVFNEMRARKENHRLAGL